MTEKELDQLCEACKLAQHLGDHSYDFCSISNEGVHIMLSLFKRLFHDAPVTTEDFTCDHKNSPQFQLVSIHNGVRVFCLSYKPWEEVLQDEAVRN